MENENLNEKLNEKLTEKQRAFCREYLACGDEALAAERAGYAPGRAKWCGRRALESLAVQRELERLRLEQEQVCRDWSARAGKVAKKTEILQFLTGVMRGELRDRREVVSNGQVRVVLEGPKLSERTRAAELLGKSKRLFSDKPKESGKTCAIKIWGEDELAE